MHHDTPSKPHVYTQEEAIQMKHEIWEKDNAIDELESKVSSVRGKLDIALQCMEKEQLIEFINKII